LRQIGLQLLGCEQGLIGQQHHALDAVAQLADVAGPRMLRQRVQRFGAEVHVFLVRLVGAVHKVQGQLADVARALGQRWQPDRDHVQAVVQVLPKAPGLHFGRQVAVGGRHQAYIDLDFALAAQPHHGAFLQGAQQLGLQGQGQLPDFVQKNGATVCLLEPAGPGLVGPGEGTTLMAKQLRLEQGVRNR